MRILLRIVLLVALLAGASRPATAMTRDDLLFYGTESLARERFDRAAQAFGEVLTMDPENSYARGRLALAKIGTGQLGEARKILEAAIAARGDDLFALWTLGCLELLEGNPVAANARFTAMDKADPGNVRSLIGQGLAALAAGRRPEGVAFLAKAQESGHEDALAHHLTGLAYWLLDAPVNARLELEATLELEPRNSAALDLLGLVYKRLDKQNLAKSAWEQALAVNAEDARARFFLSRMSQDAGLAATLSDQPDEAKRAYERALALDPTNAAAAKALGVPILSPGQSLGPRRPNVGARRPTAKDAAPSSRAKPRAPSPPRQSQKNKAPEKPAGPPPATGP